MPVKANGFQDRLVMTTSIPLHSIINVQKNSALNVSATSILTNKHRCVNRFLRLYFFFLSYELEHAEYGIYDKKDYALDAGKFSPYKGRYRNKCHNCKH